MRSVETGSFGEANNKLVMSNGIGLNDQSSSMLDLVVGSCDLDGMVGC